MKKTLVLFLLVIQSAFLFGDESLKLSDIHGVMKQIFNQHVSQKEMTRKDIQNSFKLYIDKFDPKKRYLLQAEIEPYFTMTDGQADYILENYKSNDFSAYEQLNTLIQNAIMRARGMRKEIEQSSAFLAKTTSPQDFDSPKQFAKNREELHERIENQLSGYFQDQIRRYGNKNIIKNKENIIRIFEKDITEQENNYLYRDDKGNYLSKEEREDLFVTHLLKALAGTLDAHTAFYNETEASQLKMRLEKEFEGVGIVFKQDNGYVKVDSFLEDSPAEKNKMIKPNDILVEVNGKKVEGLRYDKIMELLKNSQEHELNLLFKREDGTPIRVNLKKQELTLKGDRVDASYKKIDGGIIAILKLHSFYQGANGATSEEDLKKALTELSKKGPIEGLILDLRENTGGFLAQAVRVAGLFITNGVVVISKYFDGKEHYYRDIDNHRAYNGPFVILTSRATASAAEIVAQSLQDYGVAIIVGDESTYGKGTIQNQTVTGDNQKGPSLFKVTVGKYYTVSGKTPQLEGVKADVIVPGLYSEAHIGEQYLDFTVSNDKIDSEYVDDLADVKPNLRGWFLRNYVPSLQHKEGYWQKMIPELQVSSAKRLASNLDYQTFLKQIHTGHVTAFYTRDENGVRQPVDFQLNEAENVIKDMISMQKQEQKHAIVQE